MSEKRTVAEVYGKVGKDAIAETIATMWRNSDDQRREWKDRLLEIRNYLFATDTSHTTNADLPWKNSTTLPKLTQIRDNLHANYYSALFPTDDFFIFEPGSRDETSIAKRRAIEAYVKNKVEASGFKLTCAQLLQDYIDTGNVYYDVIYVDEKHVDEATGEVIQGYVGPKMVRTSYRDIVFDPMASSFENTWKIERSLKTFGELMAEIENEPESLFKKEALAKSKELRGNQVWGLEVSDYELLTAYTVDGFNTYKDYIASGYVEILTFEGSLYINETGEFLKNRRITVIDRCYVLQDIPMPSWYGKSTKGHCGWRERPDNLYAMGPLENLVGMQYRIDHLENAKADAHDLAIHPPMFISGSVEEFEWGPGVEINGSEGASIMELGKNLNGVIAAVNDIDRLEQKMEEFAGAPKQAMGIRTPGEKTAFEVQTLEQASSRIFQQKLRNFEIHVVERALNLYLELGRRHLKASDQARVQDDDFGVISFLTITKEDITASGKLKAIGARHFAAQAMLVQNLMNILNSTVFADQGIRPHFSGKAVAKLLEEILGLKKFQLVGDNIQVMETTETQQLVQQAQEDIQTANMVDPMAPPEEEA
jgi:hypothetical protein